MATTTKSVFDPDDRADPSSGIFGLDWPPEEAAVVLLPVPFDGATSWGRGAAGAPAAIVAASHQLDLFDPLLGTPYTAGIAMLPEPPGIAARNDEARRLAEATREGDDAALARVNALCGELHAFVKAEVGRWLDAGKRVGTLGGDHSVAYGAIAAHLERRPGLGVLQIDAHADLRKAYEGLTWSHASVMRNLLERDALGRLVQVGLRDVSAGEVSFARDCGGRVFHHFDAELAAATLGGTPWTTTVARILEPLPEEVYVSFDIDGLDAALCPHTGTPVPGGLSFAQARLLLDAIPTSGRRLVGFDLTEVVPAGDPAQSWDAVVAASLLYRLCGHAIGRRA